MIKMRGFCTMRLHVALTLLLWASHSEAKAVFAHFMVGNTPSFTQADWEENIALAQTAHIDAFALNMAYDDSTNDAQLPLAFAAAVAKGFSLFFSFDYAGNGPWPEADVTSLLTSYISNSAYYHSGGKPFVSTFEGPASAADWITIKATTNCLFYPDWSSLGAKDALAAGGGDIPDGLFSWAGWPWGNTDMDTYVDASYGQFLDDVFGGDGGDFSHYMMPVSPWFYTNLPGYDKNWLWRGDSLWFDRWIQVMYLQPEFVEILTWNDFGESHYIGPLDDTQYDAFTIGEAPYNYVLDMPHDGWRVFLPYLIDTYKNNVSTVSQEAIVAWYRPNPVTGSACATGDTSGNTHSQFQVEFQPGDIVEDNIFYSAMLAGSGATVTVTIGGTTIVGGWAKTPDGGIGIYHGNVSMNGLTGAVTVTLSRGGAAITGAPITTACTDNIQNWNAWVGYAYGETVSATPTAIQDQVCVAGTGAGNFVGLCEFTCHLGYCPVGACVCTKMGQQVPLPTSLNVIGYPASGLSASYEGICAFACNYGYCPEGVCGLTKEPESTPTISPFLAEACTGGEGAGNLGGLCGFGCGYGYCPIIACTCTSKGALGTLPAYTGDDTGVPLDGLDTAVYGDLCKFAFQYGYYPTDVCGNATTTGSVNVCIAGTGPDNVLGLCQFSCNYGFCPSPCTCTSYGSQVTLPTATGALGYPLAGEDDSYAALCEFTCNLGYCPDTACSTSPAAGDGGVIYLPPSIWDPSSDPVGCNGNAECTFIIPPSPLPAPVTVSWPPLTTTLLSSSGGSIGTKTTVISVPPFTITEIIYWSIVVTSGDPAVATFIPEQSIMPPGFVITLPGTEATFPPSQYPSYSNFLPVASSTSSSTTLVPLFYSSSHGVSIQPMPTISINTPTPSGTTTPVTKITYSSSASSSQATCTSNCGTHDCGIFGCGLGCGLFGCGGGCGIFGCGGGCGLLGCGGGCGTPAGCGSTDCPLTNPFCSNPGCTGGECPGGGLGEGDGEPTTASQCEPSTVTYTPCATTTICPLKLKKRAPAPAAACTTTTSCEAPQTTVGCNIDPETGEENDGFSTLYVVYPVDGTTSAGTDPLTSLLESYGSQSVTGLTTETSTVIGIMFWTIHLTPAQVTELESNSLVDSVTPQCTSCPDPFVRVPRKHVRRNETLDDNISELKARELGLVRQKFALPQLVMVSQENGRTLAEYDSNYVYDSSEGTGTIVYVVDTYINTADEEFAKFASQITVLDAGEGAPTPSIVNKDPMLHGTCVLSLIASDTFGVSKNIVPVLIGMTSASLALDQFNPEAILIGINLALQHYQGLGGSKSVGRAVINLSLGLKKANVATGWVNKCRLLLKNLVALGVLPVVASGNDGLDSVDVYPALFAASDIPQILVVGSVTPAGVRSDFSNLDTFVTVHAPGEDTSCSNGIGSSEVVDGTSMATGMVSGLAAYFSSLSSLTATLNAISPVTAQITAWKTYIEDRTYQRDGGDVKAIWNGVPWTDEPLSCPLNAKRQEYNDCSATSSTAPKPTTTAAVKPTTTTAAAVSTPTNTYDIYLWTCEGETETIIYAASAVSESSMCESINHFFSNPGGIIKGDSFTVCDTDTTVTAVDGSFTVSGGGVTGTCSKAFASPSQIGSCLGQSGAIAGVGCLVELAYTCDAAVC